MPTSILMGLFTSGGGPSSRTQNRSHFTTLVLYGR